MTVAVKGGTARSKLSYNRGVYNIREAQKNFEKLLRDALRGKEVILARRNTPVAKLIPIQDASKKRTSRSRSKS